MIAALGVVVISASFGFMGGRLSARLVPVDSQPYTAVRETQLPAREITLPDNSSLGSHPAAVEMPAESSPGKKGPQSTVSAPQGAQVSASDAKETGGRNQEAQPEAVPGVAERADMDRIRGATVINAGSAEAGSGEGRDGQLKPGNAEATDSPAAGILEKCARRYSSFRRNDGTYQPHNGGPRKPCPLLR